MRAILLGFLILFTTQLYSQDTLAIKRTSRIYINIKTFQEKEIALTRKDSADFMFQGQDTLVLVSKEFAEDLLKLEENQVKVKYEPKDDEFLEKYKKVVFGNEDNTKTTLKIWKEDVKIYFDTSVPKLHTVALMDFALGLSTAVDSLTIREVASKEESNYLVYYLNNENDEDFEPRINKTTSGYYLNWNTKQQITKASLKVNTQTIKNERYQIANLKFNFFRSLGYFGESSSRECRSYLSTCPMIRSLTSDDMEILKYHYSYGICKGTGRKEFEQTHARMKEILNTEQRSELYIVHTL